MRDPGDVQILSVHYLLVRCLVARPQSTALPHQTPRVPPSATAKNVQILASGHPQNERAPRPRTPKKGAPAVSAMRTRRLIIVRPAVRAPGRCGHAHECAPLTLCELQAPRRTRRMQSS